MLWSNKFKKIVLIFMHQSLSIKQIVIPHPVKTTSLQDMQEKDLCLKFQSHVHWTLTNRPQNSHWYIQY
jgi:hypothetical protein